MAVKVTILRRLPPTVVCNCHLSPLPLQHLYRICNGSRLRFLAAGHTSPSIRPPLSPFSRLRCEASSLQSTWAVEVVWKEHLLDNAGWWYDDIRNLESSGHQRRLKAHPRRASGLAHHPTFPVNREFMMQPGRYFTYSFMPKPSTLIHHLKEILVFFTSIKV